MSTAKREPTAYTAVQTHSHMRSLVIASGALVISAGLLAPLGRSSFDPDGPRVAFEAMLGGAVVGTTVLVLLVAPVLLVCRRVVGNLPSIPPACWAAFGGLLALVPSVLLNEPGGSLWTKIDTTFDGIPGVAFCFPYLLGGGLLGWNLFRSPWQADRRMDPAPPARARTAGRRVPPPASKENL